MLGIDFVMAVFAGIRTYVGCAGDGARHLGVLFRRLLAMFLVPGVLRGHIGGGLPGSFIAIVCQECLNDRRRTQQQKGNSAEKLADPHESLPIESGFRSVTWLTVCGVELA